MKVRSFADIKNVLFDNLTAKQTIFKNTFWLASAHGIDKVLKLILIVYVARVLGATEYGKFAFSLAFVALFCIFFNLGTNLIIIRDFAKDKKREKEFSAILSLKIVLGLITLTIIWISSFLVTPDPVIQRMILILGLFNFFENFCFTIYAFFQARQRMEYHALTQILGNMLLVGVGLIVIYKFPLVENLAYSYLFSVLMIFAVALAILNFKIWPISINWDINIWRKFLKQSWPLAFVGIFYYIYNHIDSVMMGYFNQITQVGWYNIAYGITGIALVPMALITTNFYPVLSKTLKDSKERFQKIWNYQMEWLILLVLPLVVGGEVLSPKIIDFLYGQEYAPSSLAFQILLFMVGIIFLYSGLQKLLIIFNQQKKIFQAMFFGAIINIVLNLLLIPKFSLYGAAFSTVVTHFLIFILFARFTMKFVSIKLVDFQILVSLIGAIVSSIVMYFIVSYPPIYSLHVIPVILIGGGAYLGLFWLYRNMINKKFKFRINKIV